MGGLTLPGRHKQKQQYRRLTVPELELYLRQGCSCSVCEYVHAEIRAQQMEAQNEQERMSRAPRRSTNDARSASRRVG